MIDINLYQFYGFSKANFPIWFSLISRPEEIFNNWKLEKEKIRNYLYNYVWFNYKKGVGVCGFLSCDLIFICVYVM